VRRDPDGVWRSRSDRFRPRDDARIWVPPNASLTPQARSFFALAQPVTSLFGLGVSSLILENTWVLPLSGGELIFWPDKPDFIRDAAADLDYRETPWVTLTAPGVNPAGRPRWTRPDYDPAAREWLISVVAPFQQGGRWGGSVGHDILLRNLLRWLIPVGRPSPSGLMASPLYVVAADGRLIVEASGRPSGARLPEAHRRVLGPPPDGQQVFPLEFGNHHLIVALLQRLEARAVYRVDSDAIAALLSRELRGLQLGVALFLALLLLIGLVIVRRETIFRQREQRLLEDRNRELEELVQSRTQEPLALLMVDVDHFKLYNDTLGHPAGDGCLRDVARELRRSLLRAEDRIFRYGGEEFVALLANTDAADAGHCAERLRRAVADQKLPHPRGVVTISLGVATAIPPRQDGDDGPSALVARADAALYRAKQQGRNAVAMAGAQS
jgi:diguanylate cyclase (GGDEF)-like protein